LQQLHDEAPDPATARALEAYLMAGAEHGLNASTFAARVIVATRADLASAICGAIGALKGPLHGGAPAEVLGQLDEIGTIDHAEAWAREKLEKRELIMGFGHRVYRAYDPRAAALRVVAERLPHRPQWLDLAIVAEEAILRVFAELKPNRVIKTNVEFYAAAVLQGVGLSPDLFPATFGLARLAGWSAHVIEQAYVLQVEPQLPIRRDGKSGPTDSPLPCLDLSELRQRAIRQALAVTRGQKAKAARLLGVHANTMTRLLREIDGQPE
jgi:citrate synthase